MQRGRSKSRIFEAFTVEILETNYSVVSADRSCEQCANGVVRAQAIPWTPRGGRGSSQDWE